MWPILSRRPPAGRKRRRPSEVRAQPRHRVLELLPDGEIVDEAVRADGAARNWNAQTAGFDDLGPV